MAAAVKLIEQKRLYADGMILEIVVWMVPRRVPPSRHDFKYSLFYGRPGERLIGFDNERGKGDHMHVEGVERRYRFTSLARLLDDFGAEVARLRGGTP